MMCRLGWPTCVEYFVIVEGLAPRSKETRQGRSNLLEQKWTVLRSLIGILRQPPGIMD